MKAGINRYFFDTYALIEINKGNEDYAKYQDSEVITTLLNLMEFFNVLLRESNKEIAEYKFKMYLNNCMDITPNIIMSAVEFRLNFNKQNKSNLSYVDAIGYIIAINLNIKFLTGDPAFEHLDNVEYVK